MNSSNESLDNLKHERYDKILHRRRYALYALQWFFLSGLFTLTPFLYSTHSTELGLSILERTWIHLFSSIILTLICSIALHRNLHSKLLIHFKPLVITFLIIAVISHTALLFVPKTARIARYPKITLNCTTSGSLLRIELCPNLIKSETLLNHPTNLQFSSNIQSQYSSFQCDHLLRTSSRTADSQSSNAHANHYLNNFQNEVFYRDSQRETNYNNEFTTFSMTRCKGICPIDFQTKYEANKEQMLRYYERSSIQDRRMKNYKNTKPYNGVMDTEYDTFNGRVQVCFRKSTDSNLKYCYTPDPDSVEPTLNNFQSQSNYIHNIINFPALNSTIYRVKQIKFHSKIQSWQPVSTIPQLPDLMYPYPSCLFSQVVPVFMDGQSFDDIICPNPLENTRYTKNSNEHSHRSTLNDNNVDSYYELNNLDSQNTPNTQSSNSESNYYQTNCDTICNTNLIYRGQIYGKYFGHHSMQLPYSPIVCNDIVGDPLITFYSYLIIRCIADLSLMISFLIIDSLSVYYSANFDTIYGGFRKAISLGTPAFIWPVISGFLIDYYSSITGKSADYSPAFVLFIGFLLIGCSLVFSLQIAPSMNEFRRVQNNHNISNTFIADLCGSNLNCDKLGKEQKQQLHSSRPELNKLIKISFKSKFMLVLILPFVVLLGFYFSLTQLQMNTYYLSIGASRMWIGLVISIGYLFSTVFILIVKPLLSAIGRLNLIVLGFVFYALMFAGNSLLQANVKWSLLPFNLMTAFSFVLSWIGCTATVHHLMKLNRLGHVKLQLTIGLIQFGYGRILASVVWFFWYYYYDQLKKCWLINYFVISELDDRPINRIEMLEEMNAFRVLIRVLSLFAIVFAIVFFAVYHMFAKCEQINCHWRRDHYAQKNRRHQVNRSFSKLEDDDLDDLDKIEEEEYLNSKPIKVPNKQETSPSKTVKIDSKDQPDKPKKKVYRPLHFFQTNNNQTNKDKDKDNKDKNKINKRKPSVNANKLNRIDQKQNKSNRKVGEEMV